MHNGVHLIQLKMERNLYVGQRATRFRMKHLAIWFSGDGITFISYK